MTVEIEGVTLHLAHPDELSIQWVGQDEINLVLGGNAAKIFKLPVPFERMFLCGRPDINGIYWKETIPYIPIEQVMYPDDKAAKELTDETKSAQERLKGIAPVVWIGAGPYFSLNPAALGTAGDWKDLYKKEQA
jgi:hypothetical protein